MIIVRSDGKLNNFRISVLCYSVVSPGFIPIFYHNFCHEISCIPEIKCCQPIAYLYTVTMAPVRKQKVTRDNNMYYYIILQDA